MDLQVIDLLLNSIYMFVCIVGLIGNILALLSFSIKKYQNTIFSSYFRVLILIDILVLLFRIDYFLKTIDIITFRLISSFMCKFTMYLVYLLPALSSWLIVLISLDRFVSIFLPSKFMFRKKLSFQLLACLLISIYNISLSTTVLVSYEYYFKIDRNKNKTEFRCKNFNPYIDMIDFLNSSLIPFIIMIISTCFTLRNIFVLRKKLDKSISSKDIRFAITSIAMNVSFFLLKFPSSFYLALNYFLKIDYNTNYFIYTVLSIFMYMQHGSTFFITLLTNKMFRKEIWQRISKFWIKK